MGSLEQLCFCILVAGVVSLTGAQVAAFCHCDLISSFCEPDCCCDTDCGTAVTDSCFNRHSNTYCPDPTFFQRVEGEFLSSQGCFHFNSTDFVADPVSLTSAQAAQTIAAQLSLTQVPPSSSPVDASYTPGDVLALSGSESFYWVSSAGACLESVDTSTSPVSLRFGVDLLLSCSCASCSSLPQLFSQVSGKTIRRFKGSTTDTLTLPTITDASITSVELNFVLGQYGSGGIGHIQRLTYSLGSPTTSQRSLRVRFVKAKASSSAPSFFPQVPHDIFYPLHLLQ